MRSEYVSDETLNALMTAQRGRVSRHRRMDSQRREYSTTKTHPAKKKAANRKKGKQQRASRKANR